MADTGKRLVGPTLLTAGNQTFYTVPVGTATIVRNIHAASVSAGAAWFSLGIGSAVTPANAIFYQMPIPPNGIIDWSGFLVLNAGDTLQSYAQVTSAITLTISGVEVA